MRELLVAAARAHARSIGCTCDVEIEIQITELAPGVLYAAVAHDQHCPIIRKAARHNN